MFELPVTFPIKYYLVEVENPHLQQQKIPARTLETIAFEKRSSLIVTPTRTHLIVSDQKRQPGLTSALSLRAKEMTQAAQKKKSIRGNGLLKNGVQSVLEMSNVALLHCVESVLKMAAPVGAVSIMVYWQVCRR